MWSNEEGCTHIFAGATTEYITCVEKGNVIQSMGIGSIDWPAMGSYVSETATPNPLLAPGREDAFEGSEWQSLTLKMYDALHAALCRYLRGLGLTIDAAEDVVQETFLRLARCLRDGGKINNMQAWIFQVAHNLSMDIHRAHQRSHVEFAAESEPEQELADPNTNPEWVYLQKEKFRQLRLAMTRLTPRQFRSVLLRAEGLRYREIALILGVSEQRAIHLVKRALVRLVETR
jgi:RNA polymerase sigma-70 factor (ECF subfamily)